MNTDLQIIERALVEFSAVEAGLAVLRNDYANVVYDVATTAGMNDAKAARVALREPRYEIERIRKSAKAPLLALGKKLDSDAARITAEIEKLEGPIDAQIKAEEGRKEAEKQARIEAEQKRVAEIQEGIEELRGCRMLTVLSGSELIAEHISDTERLPVDVSFFEEFLPQAIDAKAAGLLWLHSLHDAAVAHEQEQDRIKAERVELDRLRAEQAKRDAEERAKLAVEAEEQRKAHAARDAEAAAELRKQREAMAAEQARLDADRAEVERQQKAIRDAEAARIATEQAAAAKAKTQKRPTDAEIIKVIASHFNVTEQTAAAWVASMRAAA